MRNSHILLLLSVILSIIAGASLSRAESALPSEETCSRAASERFITSGYKPVDKTNPLGQCSWSYESHHNRKLDTCFILISGRCLKDGETNSQGVLVDLLANREYALYSATHDRKGVLIGRFCTLADTPINMVNGREFNKQTKKWDVSEGYLKSLKEPFSDPVRSTFDDWVRPYMED